MTKLRHILLFVGGLIISVLILLFLGVFLVFQSIFVLPIIAIVIYVGSIILLLLNKEKITWVRILVFIIEPLILILIYFNVNPSFVGFITILFMSYLFAFVNLIILISTITYEKYALIDETNNIEKRYETQKELSTIKYVIAILIITAGILFLIANPEHRYGYESFMIIIYLPTTIFIILGGYIGIKKLLK